MGIQLYRDVDNEGKARLPAQMSQGEESRS